jgi:hypothetical protein
MTSPHVDAELCQCMLQHVSVSNTAQQPITRSTIRSRSVIYHSTTLPSTTLADAVKPLVEAPLHPLLLELLRIHPLTHLQQPSLEPRHHQRLCSEGE